MMKVFGKWSDLYMAVWALTIICILLCAGMFGAGWKLMMWGFSLLMHMRAYSLLAFGIKCLIDFRIDEILSDTGLKRQKNK